MYEGMEVTISSFLCWARRELEVKIERNRNKEKIFI
jgi:hypothetical protein